MTTGLPCRPGRVWARKPSTFQALDLENCQGSGKSRQQIPSSTLHECLILPSRLTLVSCVAGLLSNCSIAASSLQVTPETSISSKIHSRCGLHEHPPKPPISRLGPCNTRFTFAQAASLAWRENSLSTQGFVRDTIRLLPTLQWPTKSKNRNR